MPSPSDIRPEILIDNTQANKEYLTDLIRYRELFYFFAWRDILVRYKQAFFGISWALVRPLLNMAIFAFLFGKIANFSSGHVSYPLFVLAGMLPWQLFSNAVVDTCNSLVNNSQLVSKIYFPRIIIPTAQIIVHLLDFAVTAILLIFLCLIMGEFSLWTFLTIPAFLALVILLCVGTGLWLSALTVRYRDFRIIVPFMVQFGMFLSPVGYGTFIIPEKWQWLYFMNPMAGIIDGFRWAFFGITYPAIGYSIAASVVVTAIFLMTGFHYFRKTELTFADQI